MINKYLKEIITDGNINSIVTKFNTLLEKDFKNLIIDSVSNIVKIELKIYYNEDDDAIKMTVNDVYATYITWLQDQTVYPIQSTSLIITNLNEFIFPFFKEYSRYLILEMKKIADNYLLSIMHQSSIIKIINDLHV